MNRRDAEGSEMAKLPEGESPDLCDLCVSAVKSPSPFPSPDEANQ